MYSGGDFMKFVLAPDSFKGTISALEASTIMKNNILKHYPSAIIEELPIADGGEGVLLIFIIKNNYFCNSWKTKNK